MSNGQNTSKEISIKDAANGIKKLVAFLFSKWLILGVFAFVGGVTGISYAWIQDAQYEAVLTFSTDEDKTSAGSNILGLASQFGFNLGGAGNVFSGDNIVPLIQSQKIILASLFSQVTINGKPQSLLNLYFDASHMSEKFKNAEAPKNVSFPLNQDIKTFSRIQDSVLQLIINKITKENLTVTRPDSKMQIYKIDCISPNENFSKEFVQQLIKKVSEFYIETKTKRSQQTVEILQKRADSIRTAYNSALYGRATLTDANINPAFQTPTVGIQSKQTDITVLATAYGEIIKNLELAKFNLLRETPLIQVIDEPMLPLKNLKPGRLSTGIIFSIFFILIGAAFLTIKRFAG